MNYQLAANTIRGLAMDGVEKAKSGHPGMPMGMADVAAVLWLRYLKHDPTDPAWPDRDRFVLSAGHGSMLVYSLLHLAGYDLPIEELQKFRQVDSKTPGHPEFGETVGVETTTGPLGQGSGNAVGMAIAEQMLTARFNREGLPVVNHRTYVIAGDGCLMEGVSHEVFSLAGHLKLGKLVLFYDSNHITIEGSTDLAYSDDVRKRFEGYHWNVLEIDGHNPVEIEAAIDAAIAQQERPTIVITHTHIAHGAPRLHDSHEAHGAPLGPDEVRAAKQNLGLPADRDFYVSEAVREQFAARRAEMTAVHDEWKKLFGRWRAAHPDLAAQWKAAQKNELPADLDACLPVFDPAKPIATRAASGRTLQELAKKVPNLVGGSADLAPSNNTHLKDQGDIAPGAFAGRNFHFGVRELGMGAVMNGIALHGGFRIYGATFLVFADYCRPAIRLAALMKIPVVYVFTHDSIFVGEDGPTHQPVEHFASLRAIPNLTVIRPADATETAAAWTVALRNTTGPTALLLTRQNLPILDRATFPPAASLGQGAYTLWESKPGAKPDLVLIATGSEVSISLDAARTLAAEDGRAVRVVNMPSWELFERQTRKYRNEVIPPACKRRLAVEAGVSMGWAKYVGLGGATISIDRFGASGPAKALGEKFGITAANVLAVARSMF
ncbi:MAG: transketolase [Verrucomicrobia bacterium A1]|nr:MAG: transketolase [Verrucomicrobia bacterium A1]